MCLLCLSFFTSCLLSACDNLDLSLDSADISNVSGFSSETGYKEFFHEQYVLYFSKFDYSLLMDVDVFELDDKSYSYKDVYIYKDKYTPIPVTISVATNDQNSVEQIIEQFEPKDGAVFVSSDVTSFGAGLLSSQVFYYETKQCDISKTYTLYIIELENKYRIVFINGYDAITSEILQNINILLNSIEFE